MSNFYSQARHPLTGKIEFAEFIDDGKRHYLVRFRDGIEVRECGLEPQPDLSEPLE